MDADIQLNARAERFARKFGAIKRIHVNRQIIAANRKYGTDHPAITVQTSAGSLVCRSAEITGPSKMRSDKPLSCGARIYLETRSVVLIQP